MTHFTAQGAGFTFSIFQPPPQQDVGLYRSQEGTGFPSCCRALAKIPPNRNDANGYYKTLGLDPWATLSEIKSAIRRLLAKYHPDTEPEGTTEDERAERMRMFDRIKEIAEVLTNPIHKANYDSIQAGRKLIDSEVKREMEDRGISHDDPGIQKFANMGDEDEHQPNRAERRARKKQRYWDYLAVDHNELDLINVQEWYAYLLDIAPMFRYEAQLKILMHDGKISVFKRMGGVLLIPRAWEPSSALAFHMMITHVGWPDVTRPRYPVAPEPETFGRFFGTGVNGGGGLLRDAQTWSNSTSLAVQRPDV